MGTGMMQGSPAQAAKILVVEDERIVARDLCRTLEDLGYRVGVSARSLDEALQEADAQTPDLILMDIQIKGSADGIEAAAQLKHRHPVPVVFLTASTDEGTLRRAFNAHPDGYLPKPFTRATLRTAIELALQRHEVESQLRESNGMLAAQKRELESRTNELRIVSEMGDALQLCDSTEEVIGLVSRYGGQLLPEGQGVLYLIEGSATMLDAAATWGQLLPIPPLHINECRALYRNKIHWVVPPEGQPRCAHLDGRPQVPSVCVPLSANGKLLGVLSVTFPDSGGQGPSTVRSKERLVTVTAQRLALTLNNLHIKSQLLRESIIDPLTGLFNRRYLGSAFDRELQLASRNGRPVGVLMCDLDHFKGVNDQFGHAAADRVLCEMAAVLRSRLRAYDVPSRYGGDETVVLLPDTTLEGACAVAEKVRQAVREMHIVYGAQALPPTTMSAGVAAYPAHGDSVSAVLRAADMALFRAKAGGRDRVALAERDYAEALTAQPVPVDRAIV